MTTTSKSKPKVVDLSRSVAAPSPDEAPVSLYSLGLELRHLSREIDEAAEMLESDDPAIAADAIAQLEQYLLPAQEERAGALGQKADRLCFYTDRLAGRAAFLEAQGKRLLEMAKADGRKIARLHETLFDVLLSQEPDATKFQLPTHTITSRASEGVEIEEGVGCEDLPMEFVREVIKREPDKTGLKQAIKAGAVIDGVALVKRRNWKVEA